MDVGFFFPIRKLKFNGFSDFSRNTWISSSLIMCAPKTDRMPLPMLIRPTLTATNWSMII
jgi:hypothetical protein